MGLDNGPYEPVDNPGGRYEILGRPGEYTDAFRCGTCGEPLGGDLHSVRPHELRQCVRYLAACVTYLHTRVTEGDDGEQ